MTSPRIAIQLDSTTIRSILTRASGYLAPVCSHSLNPYRGCALGNSLCGVACYVQHNFYVTRGRRWGSFVEVRHNAAESYRAQYARERAWACRQAIGRFSIFMSSSTEPFQPIERTAGITRSLLETMIEMPPDELIVQTHSHHVAEYGKLLRELSARTALRVHISIETDRDRLPGLPPAASPVAKRISAAGALRAAGVRVVATVSPLLPIDRPEQFFRNLSDVADAVVIDHYIGGDGSAAGSRTARTALPAAIAAINPHALTLGYRDEMAAVARRYFPGRVGIGAAGFAGKYW